jgi:protein-histidine pros-kinase
MSDPSRKPSGVLAATLLILFGVVLFIVLAWSSHASLRGVDAATDARSRSRTGLLLAAEVMSALKDIETGQRGYVLTGDEHYLGPYERGMRSLDKSFEALRSTLAGQPEARLETLWPLIDRRVALAERNIADRRNLPEEDSRWKQRLDEGRDTMDRIRERFAASRRCCAPRSRCAIAACRNCGRARCSSTFCCRQSVAR